MVLNFGVFDDLDLLFVAILDVFLVTNVVTDLHLLFNQVLGLNKRANKVVSFLTFEMSDLVLMDNVGNFELLFFSLKLVLLIYKFLPQNALLVVQVEEDRQILCHLIGLLALDNSVDFSLLRNILFDCVYFL